MRSKIFNVVSSAYSYRRLPTSGGNGTGKITSRKTRSSIFFIFLLLSAYLTFTTLSFDDTSSEWNAEDVKFSKTWASDWHENNITCHIPHVDPYHPSIVQFIEKPKQIKCEKKYPLLFKSTLDSTIVPVKSLEEYEKLGVKDPCCYHVVTRKVTKVKPDNSYELSKACYPVSLTVETVVPKDVEFIAIRCSLHKNFVSKVLSKFDSSSGEDEKNVGNTTIVDMHAFIPVKPLVEQRIRDFSINKSRDKNVDTLNVVILGLDGVSHMNFIRVMPKTHAYLINHLSAVEMNGFNKIGDNTFPNMAAVLTGLPTTKQTISCEYSKTYDKCPMIWKTFAQNGYRTSYGEDATHIGIFNYMKYGFRQVPTDYYLRPFGVAAEKLIGNNKATNVNQCYGPRLQFNVILNYMKKLAYAMGQNKRYFQLLWSTSLTHDFLNDANLGDQNLLATLQWFQTNGYFENTAFVLMSDHGIRYGGILDYPAGKLELRMPLLFFVLPPWFRVKYKQAFDNLKVNSARLTTPYDLHETLGDLINLNGLTSQVISQRQMELDAAVKTGSVSRAISLFLPVPPTRTCSMAGVDDHFCICHKTEVISVGNWNVVQASRFAVSYINSLLFAQVQCGVFSLDRIKSAQVSRFSTNDVGKAVYQVSFVVKPGGGSFDASLVKRRKGWTVSGTIGRTNLYGNQSHCVDDKELKLYCYCVDLL